MELTETLKGIFKETAKALKGSDRRLFMARIVKSLGKGGQRRAEAELGWNRRTVRKGSRELKSGLRCYDNFSTRGRKPAEVHLPDLLADIEAIAEAASQTDPTFKTTRLYIRLSAAAVRKQLGEKKSTRTRRCLKPVCRIVSALFQPTPVEVLCDRTAGID